MYLCKLRQELPSPGPPLSPFMIPAFFTTDDGDIVLRAGSEPDSKHDFRVHKVILSFASPVFRDMLAFPQPLDQALDEEHQLPIVDIPEAPEVFDTILRFIYPVVEQPKIAKPSTLATLLFTADKYNISSVYPVLGERLKKFLPPTSDPLWVYIMACRFGLSDVAKEAAKVSSSSSFSYLNNREDIRHVSSTDLYRLFQFVQTRERNGLITIWAILHPLFLEESAKCSHKEEDAKGYYFRLQKAVEQTFLYDPCVGAKGLSAVLDKVPDPPRGCDPLLRSVEYLFGGGEYDHFNCPLRPMTLRKRLYEIADCLNSLNDVLLDKFFGKDFGSG